MKKPEVLILDFETALLDGTPSTESYRHDFRATHCAFAWRRENGEIKTVLRKGEDNIRRFLEKCEGIPLVAHNYSFEWEVLRARFPGMEDLLQYDTMRLAQMTDNGGRTTVKQEQSFEDYLDELDGKKPYDGLSLEACASRFLDKVWYKHKGKYLSLIESRGGKKGDLHLLTDDEMSAYNTDDAVVTLLLYEALTDILAERGIDWSIDHGLYKNTCRLCSISRHRGVPVDIKQVDQHIADKSRQLEDMETEFRQKFKDALDEIESELTEKHLSKYKSEKGRNKELERLKRDPIRFNPRSTKQLQALLIDKLKIEPKFYTKKGNPTFSAKYAFQWGDAGRLLVGRGRAMLGKKQGESLRDLSAYDGKWHISVKVASTRSGRLSGGQH